MSKATTNAQERTATGARRIHDAGDDDWSLLVRDGDVMAVKQIPYDGQRYVSTEDRQTRADKQSRYRLAADEVVAFYARQVFRADPRAFATLHQRVHEVLGA
jgi:hypothetical protein